MLSSSSITLELLILSSSSITLVHRITLELRAIKLYGVSDDFLKFQGAHWNGDPLVGHRRRGLSPDAFLEAQRRNTLLLSEGQSMLCVSCCRLIDSIATLPDNNSLCHNLKPGHCHLLAAGFHAQVCQQRRLRHPGDYGGEHPGPATGGGP